ncbi:hypothetical protein FDP41_011456 [Naegleria fowleri]|uniref:Uncharacterized protein n=1 Tax=Naegleria fowleri TaxID=5763 RepID=A0A6A5C448_NAEFO|nr:uncharacterized protein FDP41_011456 [Naegleria fowleri]KAF0982526.1 hypothetical protein FDP41_011456 [Naegleria fowleri]
MSQQDEACSTTTSTLNAHEPFEANHQPNDSENHHHHIDTNDPSSNNHSSKSLSCSLQPLLEEIRKDLIQNSSSCNHVNNMWQYVEKICQVMNNEKEQHEVYAISSLKIGLELIVVWGIVPRLLKGVGISLSKRIESLSQQSKISVNKQSEFSENEKISRNELEKLVKCVKILCDISNWDEFYNQLVLQNYLTDIYSALFQILYLCNNLKKTLEQKQKENCPSSVIAHLSQQFGIDESDRLYCSELLYKLLTQTHESMVVYCLVTLLSQPTLPQWLKNRCTIWLSKTILRPKGVFAIISVMLDNVPESNFRHYEKIVDLIVAVPKDTNAQDYFKIICPQIIKLFRLRGKNSHHLLKTSALLCGKIIEKFPSIAQELILEPILSPLKKFIKFQQMADEEMQLYSTMVNGVSVSTSSSGDSNPNETFQRKTDSSLLSLEDEVHFQKEEILCDENEIGQCVEDIHRLLFGNTPASFMYNSISPIIPALFSIILFCDSGGVSIKLVSELNRDYLWEASCLINLFKLLKNHTVAGDLFVHLITQFTVVKQHMESTLNHVEPCVKDEPFLSSSTPLLIFSHPQQQEVPLPENAIILLQAISFVKFLLLNHENRFDEESLESVVMALGILSAILCGGISIKTLDEEEKLEDLKPILNRYKIYEHQQISEMASTALLSIDTKQYKEIHGNVEEYTEEEKIKIKFDHILQDLRDPLLPVRAHGVLSLREIVLEKKKNPIIEKQVHNIFDILQSQLKDEDTYVYLGAISGLTALGDVYPDTIIPILVDTFGDKKQTIEQRLKIGESLVDLAERCGQMLPKYAHYFVYCFLKCGKENDKDFELVRASSVSNLATLVQILKFGVHPFVQDIIDCASYVLNFDKSEHVRRAAVLIFDRFAKTFKTELFEVCEAATLDQFKTILNKAAFYDTDEIVRVNAKTVICEMDDLKDEQMTPTTYIPGADKNHYLNNFLKFMNH